MINIDNIFELFSSNEDIDGKDDKILYDNIKSNPIYLIGMYKKLILNHINFYTKTIEFFRKTDKELDIEDIKHAGEFVVYNRAWFYISKINIEDEIHILAIKRYSDEKLYKTLSMGIQFFEMTEQYERCSHLKKILDKYLEF